MELIWNVEFLCYMQQAHIRVTRQSLDYSSQVTFVYLSRLFEWEKLLPADMRGLFVPSDPKEAADPSATISSGPFFEFPNYPTISAVENAERANALANLAGWTIRNNAELFRSVLS